MAFKESKWLNRFLYKKRFKKYMNYLISCWNRQQQFSSRHTRTGILTLNILRIMDSLKTTSEHGINEKLIWKHSHNGFSDKTSISQVKRQYEWSAKVCVQRQRSCKMSIISTRYIYYFMRTKLQMLLFLWVNRSTMSVLYLNKE